MNTRHRENPINEEERRDGFAENDDWGEWATAQAKRTFLRAGGSLPVDPDLEEEELSIITAVFMQGYLFGQENPLNQANEKL